MRVLVLSRAWVFLCAGAAFLAFDADRTTSGAYGSPLAAPFGGAGETLLGVWARWDSVWYLGIAHDGYGYSDASPAFFPLYPLVSRALGAPLELVAEQPAAILIAALAASLAAFGAALYFIHRLAELELGPQAGALCVWLVALFPMSLFYGAVYSESLFLALSAGSVWFARTDRWALAGALGAGAAATRSAGIILLVPLIAIYLLGPRGTGGRARPYLGVPWAVSRAGGRRFYPLRPDAAWLALVPAALAAYAGFLAADAGDPLLAVNAQDEWARELGHLGSVPAAFVGGIWQGVAAFGDGAADIFRGRESIGDLLWAPDGATSLAAPLVNVEAGVFLAFALLATAGALRRLPLAYGAYAAAALGLALSFPRSADPGYDVPLFSLPRFTAVIFPLFMWLALVVRERGWDRPAIAASALLLGVYAAQWGTWQWVS